LDLCCTSFEGHNGGIRVLSISCEAYIVFLIVVDMLEVTYKELVMRGHKEGFNVRILFLLISFDVLFLNMLSYVYHFSRVVVGLTLHYRTPS
jgi:hypothetical protein